MSPAAAWGVMLLGGLMAYGYRAGRTVPFVTTFLLICVGVVGVIVRVNVWLLPLVAGILLIGGVLLLETNRHWVEKHLANWGHLLREWQ
jgi:CHASE2 domain-containing sensor protein